jgi:intein/homing endonuclease
MTITLERIEEIRSELRALPPAPRIRTIATKLAAIEKIASELLALRRMGYGLDTLATVLASKGLVIAPGTLKNYLRRCGATLRKRRRTRTGTDGGGETST